MTKHASLVVATMTALAVGAAPVASAAPAVPTLPPAGDIGGHIATLIPQTPRVQFWNTYCTVNLDLQNAIEAMNHTKSPTIRDYQRNVGGGVKKMQRAMENATRSYKKIRFVTHDHTIANSDMYRLTGWTAGSFAWTHKRIVTLPREDIVASSHIISGDISPKLTRTVRVYNSKSAKIANRIGTGNMLEQVHISQLPSCSTLMKKNKSPKNSASHAQKTPTNTGNIAEIVKRKLHDVIPQLGSAVKF